MTSTLTMMMPAPDFEHKTPLWCVMFQNQVVNQRPVNISTFKIRANQSNPGGGKPPTGQMLAAAMAMSHRAASTFLRGDRIVILPPVGGPLPRVMLCVCVRWRVASCTGHVADLPQCQSSWVTRREWEGRIDKAGWKSCSYAVIRGHWEGTAECLLQMY